MWNAGLHESQAEIKIAGRNINNFRYADDTTLMTESEEELKDLLMKVEEESEKAGLKLNLHKTEIMAKRWGKLETVTAFIFLGSKITVDGDWGQEFKRLLLIGKESYDKPVSECCVLVAQSCLTLCDPWARCTVAHQAPLHGVLQARILVWVVISISRGSSQPRNWTRVSCIVGRFFTIWSSREVHDQAW